MSDEQPITRGEFEAEKARVNAALDAEAKTRADADIAVNGKLDKLVASADRIEKAVAGTVTALFSNRFFQGFAGAVAVAVAGAIVSWLARHGINVEFPQ